MAQPHHPVFHLLAAIGRIAEGVARHAAQLSDLLWQILLSCVRGRVSLNEIIRQAYWMGVRSVPLVALTGVLSGIVTSQQGGYQFTGTLPVYILGGVVAQSVILELGPVMTAFVFIGRVGARITAEVGTMRVTEQIDALYSLGRDPVPMLAAPRLISGIIVMPVLVAIANASGLFAGMVAARVAVDLGTESFLYGARMFWHNWDMFYSLAKAVTFGFVVPLIAVHMGLVTRGGAEGVGSSTTSAVVFMIITVLFLDALFPPLLLG